MLVCLTKRKVSTKTQREEEEGEGEVLPHLYSLEGETFLAKNMARIALRSELNLFDPGMYQTSVIDSSYQEFLPLQTLTQNGPIEFFVAPSGVDYLDPSEIHLHVKLKVVKVNGQDYAAASTSFNTAPECNLLHNLWSNIKCELNDTELSSSSFTYPYRAYLTNLLNYSKQTAEGHLASQFWIRDQAGALNSTTSESFIKRKDKVENSKVIELYGRPLLDIAEQPLLILPGVSLKLTLTSSKDAFCLRGTAAKVHLTHVSLFVRKVKVNPSIHAAHLSQLNKSNAKYRINRKVVKVFTVPQGSQSISKDNIFLGQLPKKLTVGFVSSKSFHGDFSVSPFDFKNYQLNNLSLRVGGRSIPAKPLEPNFDEDCYFRSYLQTLAAQGVDAADHTIDLSYEDFKSGFTLFVFDLTPDQEAACNEHDQPPQHGSLRLEARFGLTLPETVNIVVLGEFNNLIEITARRHVICDFGA